MSRHTLSTIVKSFLNIAVVLHRAFSRAEAQRHRLMVEERRSQQAATGFAYYLGSNTAIRYEDGYLFRDFPIKSL